MSLLFTFLWLLLSPQHSSADACKEFDWRIEQAVDRYFPADFKYPYALRAQYFQESRCSLDAVSPVGARGIAQFMPGTWKEVVVQLKGEGDAHGVNAIGYGAYYQARQMRVWKGRPRSPFERWQLGLASYNAGLGNILGAQKACNNARAWDDMSPCLEEVTGHHSKETIGYVKNIQRHWVRMAGKDEDRLTPELRKSK